MKMVHTHAGFWMVTLILFFLGYFLLRGDKARGAKIVHMILRLFYILVIVTGVMLVVQYNYWSPTLIKGAAGLILIGLMEMIMIRTGKGRPTVVFWILFLLDFLLILYLGYGVIG